MLQVQVKPTASPPLLALPPWLSEPMASPVVLSRPPVAPGPVKPVLRAASLDAHITMPAASQAAQTLLKAGMEPQEASEDADSCTKQTPLKPDLQQPRESSIDVDSVAGAARSPLKSALKRPREDCAEADSGAEPTDEPPRKSVRFFLPHLGPELFGNGAPRPDSPPPPPTPWSPPPGSFRVVRRRKTSAPTCGSL